jgi:CBS domain-containing protein
MKRLAIHKRIHLGSDDKTTVGAFVRCPEDSRWVPVEACRRCAKCTSVDDASVECGPSLRAPSSLVPEDAPIAEVMDPSVLSVDSDATAEQALVALEEQEAPIAIVVDGGHHAIGVCSRRDLAQRGGSRRVETCMTPFLITMLEGATVADAIDVVVERGVSHVPVLASGRVAGVVTPRAVIRWLAQNLRAARAGRRGAGDGSRTSAKCSLASGLQKNGEGTP